MSENHQFSDEILNAFVDEQLGEEDMDRITAAIKNDPYLGIKVRELKRIKNLVRASYIHVKPSDQPQKRVWRIPHPALAASVVAFTFGALLTWGWMSQPNFVNNPNDGIVASQNQLPGVLFHINRNDPGHLTQVLNEVEALLKSGTEPFKIRVVASGGGLSLFRTDSAPQPERISQLKLDYQDQLIFAGCNMTYQAVIKNSHNGVELLPEVEMVRLGVLDLLEHQRKGWAYIQI